MDVAKDIGIELLTEEQYRHLQELGKFDLKHRAGYKHLTTFASSAVPSSATVAMIWSLCTTMEQIPTTPQEASVGR